MKFLDEDQNYSRINIVMELCERGSLDKYLIQLRIQITSPKNHQSLSGYITQFFIWAQQIGSGMQFLAQHGVRQCLTYINFLICI